MKFFRHTGFPLFVFVIYLSKNDGAKIFLSPGGEGACLSLYNNVKAGKMYGRKICSGKKRKCGGSNY
mgnify:CR=1 FL=1